MPDSLETMSDVRRAIDAIDDELVPLLARRLAAIHRASQLKQAPDEALVEWRVEQVAKRVGDRAASIGFNPEVAERIWRQMMAECIAYEERSIRDRA